MTQGTGQDGVLLGLVWLATDGLSRLADAMSNVPVMRSPDSRQSVLDMVRKRNRAFAPSRSDRDLEEIKNFIVACQADDESFDLLLEAIEIYTPRDDPDLFTLKNLANTLLRRAALTKSELRELLALEPDQIATADQLIAGIRRARPGSARSDIDPRNVREAALLLLDDPSPRQGLTQLLRFVAWLADVASVIDDPSGSPKTGRLRDWAQRTASAHGLTATARQTPAFPSAADDRDLDPRQQVDLFWLIDSSSSMVIDDRINLLNAAMRAAIPELRRGFAERTAARLMVGVITFSSGARWHVPPATPIEDLQWTDITAIGPTAMGAALRLAANELETPPIPRQALRPVLILVTDGGSTDDYRTGLDAINSTPWGKRALRLAIAIGPDASREILEKFVADPESDLIQARSPREIREAIRSACALVIEAVPAARGDATPVPPPPATGVDSPAASGAWIKVSGGQGMQIGDHNEQVNYFAPVTVTQQGTGTRPRQPAGGAGLRVFVSYSRQDERYRERLEISLAQLRRDNVISTWHDKKILPGEEWDREIDENLNNADLVLLLVSPDFLASDYAYGREMERALERHESGSAIVVPIIVRPADWLNSRIAALQALPSGGRPVSRWPNRDDAWLDVVQGLRRLISG